MNTCELQLIGDGQEHSPWRSVVVYKTPPRIQVEVSMPVRLPATRVGSSGRLIHIMRSGDVNIVSGKRVPCLFLSAQKQIFIAIVTTAATGPGVWPI